MRLRSIIAIVLVLVTTACSSYRREFDANPPFDAHDYRNFDVEVAWQAERTGQDVRLRGTVTNHRYAYLRDLELRGILMDEKGIVLARATVDDFPTYIPSGRGTSFQMRFSIADGATPARLRFRYTYLLAEEPPAVRGYGGYDDTPHFGKFDAPL
jgi:hypothetical protein